MPFINFLGAPVLFNLETLPISSTKIFEGNWPTTYLIPVTGTFGILPSFFFPCEQAAYLPLSWYFYHHSTPCYSRSPWIFSHIVQELAKQKGESILGFPYHQPGPSSLIFGQTQDQKLYRSRLSKSWEFQYALLLLTPFQLLDQCPLFHPYQNQSMTPAIC